MVDSRGWCWFGDRESSSLLFIRFGDGRVLGGWDVKDCSILAKPRGGDVRGWCFAEGFADTSTHSIHLSEESSEANLVVVRELALRNVVHIILRHQGQDAGVCSSLGSC